MPAVVVCEKTLVVVDGNHRIDAAKKLHGPDVQVQVELRQYPNDAAMFEEAMRLNASHGMKLTSYDKAHCSIVAKRLGISLAVIALALNTTPGRLGKLMEHKIALARGESVSIRQTITPVKPPERPSGDTTKTKDSTARVKPEKNEHPGMHEVPLKRSVSHLAGTTVTENQVKGIEEDVGSSQLFRVNQVIHLFERDLIDSGSEKLVAGLIRLRDLLNKCEWLSAAEIAGAARKS